jgi:hypothetical protein|tara:strand:+ start:779 stop:1630 length:852 start_codon:yes stop_codon:yes gene_type:complete
MAKFDIAQELMSASDYLEERDQLFVSFWGLTGLGKTWLACTFPKPIYLLSLDMKGPHGVVKRMVKRKLIKPNDIMITEAMKACFGDKIPIAPDYEDTQELWGYTKDWVDGITKAYGDSGGTVVIDTASSMWETCDTAISEPIRLRLERTKKDWQRWDYQHANRGMKGPLEKVTATSLNLVVVSHAKEAYNAKGQPTGKFLYRGFKQIPELADIHFRIGVEKLGRGEKMTNDDRYILVEKCREDDKLLGAKLYDPTYEDIADLLSGELEPDEYNEEVIEDEDDE